MGLNGHELDNTGQVFVFVLQKCRTLYKMVSYLLMLGNYRIMIPVGGFEHLTLWLRSTRSNQLSYSSIFY